MLEFTQEEVEEGLASTLGSITRKQIALKSGVSESYIKRQFNSNDEQASCLFRALQIICGIDDEDEETGEEFVHKFLSYRELSKKRRNKKEVSPIECLVQKHHLDGDFGAEILEALSDGKLTRKEIERLSPHIARFRRLCDLFDQVFSDELAKEEITADVFKGMNGHARV